MILSCNKFVSYFRELIKNFHNKPRISINYLKKIKTFKMHLVE